HRLAVTRRQRVERAPAEGGEQQQGEHALAGGRVGEDGGEAVAARVRGGDLLALRLRRRERSAAGLDAEARVAPVERAAQQIRWIAGQAVGRVPGRRVRADRGATAGL